MGEEKKEIRKAVHEELLALYLFEKRIIEDSLAGKAEKPVKPVPVIRTNTKSSVNMVELLFFLISKLHYVVIGMVLGTILFGIYAVEMSVPVYTATAKLYIIGENENSIISLSDLQMGTALTMDYQEVFKTWEVHEMVNEQLGTRYSYTTLQRMLTVENPDDTRILYISVRNVDPQHAADIANAYISAAKRFILQTMITDEPTTFSLALVPSIPSSTGVIGYALRGFLLGAVLVVGILLLVFLLDSRPKSTDDIMQYGGIPTIAVIPENLYLSGKKPRGLRRRRAKK